MKISFDHIKQYAGYVKDKVNRVDKINISVNNIIKQLTLKKNNKKKNIVAYSSLCKRETIANSANSM